MSLISIIFILFCYLSLLLFVIGLSYKIIQYWQTPAPLKIPIAPAPLTKTGVLVRMAAEDDIELSSEHWEVINFLREYFEEYEFAPAVRILTKAIAKKLGNDKGNSRYLYSLFPYGPAKQGCRFAGLPKPTGCV